MKYLYHATNKDNLFSIFDKGIKPGGDDCVYLADSAENALKFMAFKDYIDVVVFEIDINKLNKDDIKESYDHSEDFFQCKAWYYNNEIPTDAINCYYETTRICNKNNGGN